MAATTTPGTAEFQAELSAFVVTTVSRQPRQGDQVTVTNLGSSGQVWMYTVDSGSAYS